MYRALLLLLLCTLATADDPVPDPPKCDPALIKGTTEVTLVGTPMTLRCKSTSEMAGPPVIPAIPRFIVFNQKRYDKITCDPIDGWMVDEDTIPKATDELDVTCVENTECKVPPNAGTIFNQVTKILTCAKKDKNTPMTILFNRKRYGSIICDPIDGWAVDEDTIPKATEELAVTCVDFSHEPNCLVPPSAGTIFDEVTKILACSKKDKSTPMAILTNTQPHKSLKCDDDGWKTVADVPAAADAAARAAAAAKVEKVALADLACVPYCETVGEGTEATFDKATGVRKVTCPKIEFRGLFTGPKRVDKDEATCTYEGGWKGIDHDKAKTMRVHCAKACMDQDELKNDTQVALVVDKFTKEYTCIREDNNIKDKKEMGIEVNANFVYPRIRCSKEKGWTDAAGLQLQPPAAEDAFTAMKLICAWVKCKNNDACGKIQDGYNCNTISVPEMDLLKCANPKQKLYDVAEGKFYDREVTCRNALRSDDDKWLIFEKPRQELIRNPNDENKRSSVGSNTHITCLQKRCNMCEALPATATAEKSKYTPGTADDCATAECRNNLWSVKREGGAAFEQYAGLVTCSSEKATQGKWLIDGKIPIVEGNCISEVSSCVKAVKVDTKCNQEWAGCEEVNALSDTEPVTCPPGKIMFYKHNKTSTFFEDGVNMKCDKAEGKWSVTRNTTSKRGGLLRGGTVICAKTNPAPKRTMPKPQIAKSNDVEVAWIVCGSIGGLVVIAVVGCIVFNVIRSRRVEQSGNSY